jgi:hypothetical protein
MAGYGLTHIPGEMLAAAIGMTRTLVLGPAGAGQAGIDSGQKSAWQQTAWRIRGKVQQSATYPQARLTYGHGL